MQIDDGAGSNRVVALRDGVLGEVEAWEAIILYFLIVFTRKEKADPFLHSFYFYFQLLILRTMFSGRRNSILISDEREMKGYAGVFKSPQESTSLLAVCLLMLVLSSTGQADG